MSARKAFWMRDIKAAEADYRTLIAREPNDPSLHGELGNVLFMAGERAAAGEQYATAAEGFVKKGDLRRAQALLPAVAELAPQKLDALRSALMSRFASMAPAQTQSSAAPAAEPAHKSPTGAAPATTPSKPAVEPKPLDQAQLRLLMQARKAFWEHDLKSAEADYRKLIAEVPQAPAPYGELGNVLLVSGKRAAAAKAYAQAGDALLALGRKREAAELLPLLGRLDPARAQALATRLHDAGAQQPRQGGGA
ncbi:hypothetical protein [Acidihalobacter ferrooxydans]|nr:hypothetical protein [Acidihalobacter ferrooxydans]